jgi:3-deoxy-7-phosphoheptulonate synthase
MINPTDDVRIRGLKPLLPPAILMEEIPLSEVDIQTVERGRAGVREVLDRRSDKLVVVIGPCSLHDPEAGLEYAQRLVTAAAQYADDLHVLMRVYFEKPRTTVGWKGLINDPKRDGSFSINSGLRLARGFLRDVVRLGLPTGCEFLDPITPQFIADLVSWGAIGARTTESQVHRELASGLSMPIGFKNGTGGTVQIAVDAIRSAGHPHHFLSVTKQGVAAIVETDGNPYGHLILRGGKSGPNYGEEGVADAVERHRKAKLDPSIMIDCSHANSNKDYLRQAVVSREVAEQLAADEDGHILGVMLESFLVDGRQDGAPERPLVHGQSITDACMSWERSEPVLASLADAVRERRARRASRA